MNSPCGKVLLCKTLERATSARLDNRIKGLLLYKTVAIQQLVLIRARVHPFPSRTRKLSSLLPTILGWRRPGKIGSATGETPPEGVFFFFPGGGFSFFNPKNKPPLPKKWVFFIINFLKRKKKPFTPQEKKGARRETKYCVWFVGFFLRCCGVFGKLSIKKTSSTKQHKKLQQLPFPFFLGFFFFFFFFFVPRTVSQDPAPPVSRQQAGANARGIREVGRCGGGHGRPRSRAPDGDHLLHRHPRQRGAVDHG